MDYQRFLFALILLSEKWRSGFAEVATAVLRLFRRRPRRSILRKGSPSNGRGRPSSCRPA